MKSIIAVASIAALAGAAQAQVAITEILGSTGGSDLEFIEIANIGSTAIDISGWSVELWDSDDGGDFGSLDAGAPYFVSGSRILQPGETYVWANLNAFDAYIGGLYNGASYATDYQGIPFSVDAPLPANAIENSSYTAVLVDATGNALESWFFGDGDAADAANRGGAPIIADFDVPLDGGGAFLQSGWSFFDTNGDGNLDFSGELAFSTPGFGSPFLGDQDVLSGGTPGVWQIPAPGAAGLLAVAGLAGLRRRR